MNLIEEFSRRATSYMEENATASVFPSPDSVSALQAFFHPLQDQPIDPVEVLDELDRLGSPATVRSSGSRYFGFVTGGSLPAALVAKLMVTVWDQNAALYIQSPIAGQLENIASKWLISLLGLPENTGVGFVTGATMANFTAIVSARQAVLERYGWDVSMNGLAGSPPFKVIVGAEVHVSMLKALKLAGFGSNQLIIVPADDQGRMKPENIPETEGPLLVCLQAGNVNTGAFDPFGEIITKVNRFNKNAWIHVDGAFGIWAGVTERYRSTTKGVEMADSWATDAHKWLNVPYDCGLAFVKDKTVLMRAMSTSFASYLPETANREPYHFVPELSREARGIAVWAALRSLGKNGLSEMIERNCNHAKQIAGRLAEAGYSILNDVIINQVLVSFGDPETTKNIIRKIQEDGKVWCGGTVWQGKTAMRISVSSWATTDKDIQMSLNSIITIANAEVQK